MQSTENLGLKSDDASLQMKQSPTRRFIGVPNQTRKMPMAVGVISAEKGVFFPSAGDDGSGEDLNQLLGLNSVPPRGVRAVACRKGQTGGLTQQTVTSYINN